MRDVERLREKIEFSLDDRQVWALSVGALLLLAAAFTVGLLVGRKTAPAPGMPPGELAVMDAPQPKVAVAAVAAAPEKEKEKEKEKEPEKEKDAAPAVAAAPKPEARSAKPEEPKPEARSPKPVTEIPAPAAATVVEPAPKRPVQVASVTPVSLTPPPKDVGQFTVQVGASQDRAEAHKLEQKARAAGLKPYVVEADLGSKGTWYRVRVGAFKDKDAANRFKHDVERELRGSAVVMPAH